jgi:hypothetical protein
VEKGISLSRHPRDGRRGRVRGERLSSPSMNPPQRERVKRERDSLNGPVRRRGSLRKVL